MRRHFDVYPHVQVAVAVALDIFHSLATQTEHRPWLRAGRNLYAGLSIQGRDFDLGAKSGLDEAHWQFAKQIIAVALKDVMRFDMEDNVEIAVGTAPKPGFAITG